MDDTHSQITIQSAKISFEDVCSQLRLNGRDLEVIDWMADAPAKTLWRMLVGEPVSRSHAEAVLTAFSLYTDSTRTLDTVEVPLLPMLKSSFVDAFGQCPMPYQTLIHLSAHAGIPCIVIHTMIAGKPVKRADAEKVLLLLSLHDSRTWSFETIDVPLLPPPQMEEQHDVEITDFSLKNVG